MSHRTAVIVPCYNAAATIPELVQRVAPMVPRPDIYCVNDGSQDDTRQVIESAGVRLLNHEQNRGKGEALQTAFAAVLDAGYDGAVTIDADLQHLPEHLPAFLERAPDYDVIVGTRAYHLRNMPLDRWFVNHLTSLIVSALGGTRVRDCQSGYRYLSAHAMRDIPLATTRYDMEAEQLIRAGRMRMRITEVFVETVYTDSESYIHPWRDTVRFIRMAFRNLFWRPPRVTASR